VRDQGKEAILDAIEVCEECGRQLTTSEHDHRQVPVSGFVGAHAHVDEGIAELIEACWDLGIWTVNSCQLVEETGQAYIAFERGCAEFFVGAATIEQLDDPSSFGSLGWRMRSGEEHGSWQWSPGGWEWAVCFSAYFPPTDIPELVIRLRRHIHDAH
jgi:hypothetical protein